jgi:hypothetical protein
MATINFFNALSVPCTIHVDSAVVTQSGDPDWTQSQTRHLATSTVTLVPGPNQIDSTFWTNWLTSNPASTLSRVIYPA